MEMAGIAADLDISYEPRNALDFQATYAQYSCERRNFMKLPLTTVDDAGLVIRALRKHGGVRIDDFALTAKVSKQLMTDLENGKPTVQMGRVLRLLQGLGVHVTLEIPDSVGPALALEQARQARRRASRATAASNALSDT
jgi:transcriptional regulator with XRE-family HTH domain